MIRGLERSIEGELSVKCVHGRWVAVDKYGVSGSMSG